MSEPGVEEQLRQEVAGLAVDDILALCYATHQRSDPKRLRLYLDVLRKRGGERAQFASCLLCFDLARQGDPVFQREFAYLADTVRSLGERQELVLALLSGDPYLSYIWELCQAQLAELDPRFSGDATSAEPEAVAELALLSDDDFASDEELRFEADDGALWLRFDQAIEDFLGGEVGVPVYDPEAGFRMRHGRDVERVERFLRELDSLREFIPMARGFRALVLLFYGTHIRSRTLFGGQNERKQTILRDGISEFLQSGREMWAIADVIGPMHSEVTVWDKISDVLYDYAAWCAAEPENLPQGPAAYDAVGRLISRDARRRG